MTATALRDEPVRLLAGQAAVRVVHAMPDVDAATVALAREVVGGEVEIDVSGRLKRGAGGGYHVVDAGPCELRAYRVGEDDPLVELRDVRLAAGQAVTLVLCGLDEPDDGELSYRFLALLPPAGAR